MVRHSEEKSRHDKYDKRTDKSHKRKRSHSRDGDKARERPKREKHDDKHGKVERTKEKVEEKTKEQTTDQMLEEVNKYRIEAGLKPIAAEDIADDKPPLNTVSSIDEDIHKPAINIGDTQRSLKMKERMETLKERNRLKMNYSHVQTLGTVEDENLMSWLSKSRSLEDQKKAAAQKVQNIESFEEEVISGSHHTSMKVLHDVERFEEGRDVILTLMDKNVLDDKEDELFNVNFMNAETGEENVKKRNIGLTYRPWDSEEYASEYNENPFGLNEKRLLPQYNERIEGKKIKSFKLDETGKFDFTTRIDEKNAGKPSIKGMIDLTTTELKPTTDYLTPQETELKFKKFNKSRKIKVRNSKNETGKLAAKIKTEPMEVENTISDENKLSGLLPVILSDIKEELSEDDLADLNFANEGEDEISVYLNNNLKKKQFHQLGSLNATTENENLPFNVGLVIDDVSEFCRELKVPQLCANPPNSHKTSTVQEESDDTEEILLENNAQCEKDSSIEEEAPKVEETNPFAVEPSLNCGLSGAFNLALQKGYIKQEVKEKGPDISEDAREICSRTYSVEIRRVDEGDSNQRKRETRYEGNLSSFKEKKIVPKFKLEYTNEKAEILPPKEAFRVMSHRFHGKGPGKPKLEKRVKKMENERRFLYMDEHDTPLSSMTILKEKQKKEKSSYLVISGGKYFQSDKSSNA